MAVYRCEVKRISRSAGRSAVASAAYRAAERLRDERADDGQGKVFDYRRRAPGLAYREVMAPKGAPEWATQRGRLWNEAERAENRKNSTTAREAIVSLPHELDDTQRIELVRGFAGQLIERYGVAVDLAIHRPDRKGDQRNHHAHLLLTTRRLTPEGLGPKTRELDDLKTGPQEIEAIRALWEQEQNLALERAGQQERVSRLSNAAQGIDREPQPKLGEALTAAQRQGLQPRAVESWQEVARRHERRKDANRPPERRRHRLEREGIARRSEKQKSKMRENMEAQRARQKATPAPLRALPDQEQQPGYLPKQAYTGVSGRVANAFDQAQTPAAGAAPLEANKTRAGKVTQTWQQEATPPPPSVSSSPMDPRGNHEALKAWRKQREEELRRKAALELQAQNDNDPGRQRLPGLKKHD